MVSLDDLVKDHLLVGKLDLKPQRRPSKGDWLLSRPICYRAPR